MPRVALPQLNLQQVENLTDELNVGSTTLYAAWDNTVFNAYKPPRTVGMTLGYRF